ncbi:MAG: GH92 family glycosyl hydrolase [Chitinophagales bacterium]|nr:GH92 family glycosyl hydrolase [Chitinophagales bacterium]
MKLISLLFFQLLIVSYSFSQNNLSDYVNPFIGTGGHGHTFPGATKPFGMVQLSPDTRVDGSWDGCSGYHYSDTIIYGFSHTHLSGTGCSDYGDILLMPTVGNPELKPFVNGDYKKGYASHFSHKNEKATAGYYAVHLDDDDIDAAFTVTQRVGFHKYIFPSTQKANIILDLTHRDKVLDSYVHVIDSRHIEGYRRSNAWAKDQVVYFYAEFSKQMESFGIATNDSLKNKISEAKGTNVKAFFQFQTSKGEAIYIKVAISQTSMEGARNNMRECTTWDFESTKAKAQISWSWELGKIQTSGGTEEQNKVFYTALYHCMIHPSLADDVDGKYLGRDYKVHQLEPGHHYYTVFSLWDTYRALHPLLTIIDQQRTTDFINTILLEYEQGGRLPVWELSSNETDCMIGYHSVSVMADAAMKGIKFDYSKALVAMKSSAAQNTPGLNAYRNNGCIGMFDEGESVSKTLEYSYDDWCISQLAKLTGDVAAYKEFIARGQYWKNVFDWKRGFMRAKKNGGWYSPFDPFEVNFNYTEANAWQYLFAVPQDVDGLISMMGGKEKFQTKLDSLFSVSSITQGREQADISGLIGQYAQGNEPSHHMAYLYNYCGAPYKTQEKVREIMNMYTNATDGLIGNEDCGQMSAWYVMSAVGFYQVTPAYSYYTIGSPIFDTVKINLENQNTFTIIAKNNSAANKYVTAVKLNGTAYDSILFSHRNIMSGATLELNMSSDSYNSFQPKINFLPSKEINEHAIIVNPVILASNATFIDTMHISFQTLHDDDSVLVHQTKTMGLDFSDSKFFIDESQSVFAVIKNKNGDSSKLVKATFTKSDKNWKVSYHPIYDTQYNGGGDLGLIDGVSGSTNFKDGTWQGWWGNDMDVIINLGELKKIKNVSAEFLSDQKSWIFFPSSMNVSYAADGINFSSSKKQGVITDSKFFDQIDSSFNLILKTKFLKPIEARYIRIRAENLKVIPAWHFSAGEKPWIFCDEIMIE